MLEYTRAFKTIDPLRCTGKLHLLWLSFAKFWEEQERINEARKVLEKATTINFKKLDHLASVWSEFVEFELRLGNVDAAREVIQRALTVPPLPHTVPKNAPTTERFVSHVIFACLTRVQNL